MEHDRTVAIEPFGGGWNNACGIGIPMKEGFPTTATAACVLTGAVTDLASHFNPEP
eukprot:COSAG02_NODE_3083_length_7406_cov_3.325578_8_plen_56_part_00